MSIPMQALTHSRHRSSSSSSSSSRYAGERATMAVVRHTNQAMQTMLPKLCKIYKQNETTRY